jgi:hypothetical protein
VLTMMERLRRGAARRRTVDGMPLPPRGTGRRRDGAIAAFVGDRRLAAPFVASSPSAGG